jgi:hypothetical protein
MSSVTTPLPPLKDLASSGKSLSLSACVLLATAGEMCSTFLDIIHETVYLRKRVHKLLCVIGFAALIFVSSNYAAFEIFVKDLEWPVIG